MHVIHGWPCHEIVIYDANPHDSNDLRAHGGREWLEWVVCSLNGLGLCNSLCL